MNRLYLFPLGLMNKYVLLLLLLVVVPFVFTEESHSGTVGSTCCVDRVDQDGCDNNDCELIVCAMSSSCCSTVWDGECAAEALESCDVCSVEESGPVTIIPTLGQWGMIIATILLGFFAVFAIRRRIKS